MRLSYRAVRESTWHLALDGQPLGWHEPVGQLVATIGDGPVLLPTDSDISRPSTMGGTRAMVGISMIIGVFVLAIGIAGGFYAGSAPSSSARP